MTSVEFHGYTRCLNPPDNWKDRDVKCFPLYIQDYDIGEAHFMDSVWTLTEEDRKAIADGKNIVLTIVGTVHPPIALNISEYRYRILDKDPFKDYKK